ncbi:MAG: formate dehydrogenase accessory sulfurtransferase FdhD [Verrucomicrobiales bacterium]|nr:formate dehydrogenase accessory sulfurtransferase FdhD [Verrucomicrobiales bacterium]
MTDPATQPVCLTRLHRLEGGAFAAEEAGDLTAVESPLEIRLEGRSISVTMRTPGHDRELTAGFLLAEGIIHRAVDLFEISTCPSAVEGNAVDVLLTHPERCDPARLTRHVITNSSCGVCSKATLDAALVQFPLIPEDGLQLSPEILFTLPARQRAAQVAFAATGGLHASALFDLSGNLLLLREDVGRHNALDKILGAALLGNQVPLAKTVLLLSGRVSFELMQKSLAGGIPIVAAVGAPSSLAVDFARASGQTLVGFLRDGHCNVYAGEQRLRGLTPLIPTAAAGSPATIPAEEA